MAKYVLMVRQFDKMNVPPGKVAEYLEAGWQRVEQEEEAAPEAEKPAPKEAEKPEPKKAAVKKA